MIDIPVELENALLCINPIGWIDLLNGAIKHGRLHRFEWSDAPNGYEVERILRLRNIHAYGRGVWKFVDVDAEGRKVKRLKFSCWVNHRQANFAEWNLLGAGVMLESPTVNPDNWKRFGKGASATTWSGGKMATATLIERVSDMFAGLTR